METEEPVEEEEDFFLGEATTTLEEEVTEETQAEPIEPPEPEWYPAFGLTEDPFGVYDYGVEKELYHDLPLVKTRAVRNCCATIGRLVVAKVSHAGLLLPP